MSTYTVTDPTTNKSVDLEGDSPPTEEELNQIFSQVHGTPSAPSYSAKDAIGDVARPLLEGGGMAAGGLLSSPLGPIAAAGGGALGFAAGKAGADLLDRGLGRKPLLQSVPQGVGEAAGDLYSGAKMEAAGQVASKVVPPLLNAVGKVRNVAASPLFQKGMSWMGDIPEDSIKFRVENPEAVQNAQPLANIAAKDVPSVANKFDQAISGLHDAAKETLSTSRYLEASPTDEGGAFTKDEVLNAVSSARKKLGGVYTPESQTAANTLQKVLENLNKIRSTVSQNQVHDLIMDLDNEIPWDRVTKSPESLTMQDNALIDVRTKLDSLLKDKNPQYAKVMQPLSEAIQNRNEFTRNFGIQRIKGAGYQPGNNTVSRMLGATNEDRLATQRILGNTQNTVGENLYPQVKASQVSADFQPDQGGVFNPKGVKQIFGRPAAARTLDFFSKQKSIPSPMNQIDQNGLVPTFGALASKSRINPNDAQPDQANQSQENNGANEVLPNLISQGIEQGKTLTREIAKKFLDLANGSKDLARELARKAGYSW